MTGTFDPTDPVFISYRQSDGTATCAELAWLLRAAGIPVWRDKDDLPPGDTVQRLLEAMAAGLSGAVLVITPDVEKSTVVRETESPQLIDLHQNHPEFILGIANAVEGKPGSLDYGAPDRLLAKPKDTLSGVDQTSADRDGLIALTGKIMLQRISGLVDSVAATDGVFTISVQTRNTPQVYDRTGAELDIRLRPGSHQRLPSADGLRDLANVNRFLATAVTRTSARVVRITGGAHLSIAVTIGATFPSTRIGSIEVIDQRGVAWASGGDAHQPANSELVQVSSGTSITTPGDSRPRVAVYMDLLPDRSDAAYERFLDEHQSALTEWAHYRHQTAIPLNPEEAGSLAAEAAHLIRTLSNKNGNADVDLLLRCPFPIAILVGRLTNTLRITAHEWDPSDPEPGDDDYRPQYRPVVTFNTTKPDGIIEQIHIDGEGL